MRLSLVIPCYNEAANLPLLVNRCSDVFAGREEIDVVFVDNGSSDNSPEVFARHAGTGLVDAAVVESARAELRG